MPKQEYSPRAVPLFALLVMATFMATRGSVIPLFVSQIKSRNEITVTDPDMTRYLMSLEDSVELVLYAFKNAQQGDIFVRKSPACTVGDLAEAIKQLFNEKAQTKLIGTRHGEKLYETLVSREELARAESKNQYFCIPADSRDLNYKQYFSDGDVQVSTQEDYTSHNTTRLSVDEIKSTLLKLDYIVEQLND